MRPLKQATYSSRTADKFVVRLPDGMRERIAEVARTHHRSMNSEIIARLEHSLLQENPDDDKPTSEATDIIRKMDIQPWIPQVGQMVRRRDSQDILGTITGFTMTKMGVMAKIEAFVIDALAAQVPNQAVGLLEPVDITEIIEKSGGPVIKALERIQANSAV